MIKSINKLKFINNNNNNNKFIYYSTNNNNNNKKLYNIKGLNILNKNELLKLTNNELKDKIKQFKDETKLLLNERGDELIEDLSKSLSLTRENIESNISKSPFTLRAYVLAATQGITFYHHELRKQITPYDDYEREKRREFVEKKSSQDLNNELNKKKSFKKKSLDEKKSMSMEREMEIIREHEQEQRHFLQQVDASTKWEMGQLEIQPAIDSFQQDELLVSFNPYEPMESNSQTFQLTSRLSKFYWKKDITKWEMFLTSKLNQLIPQLQYHILDKITLNNNDEIVIDQLLESIQFISNEINLIDLKIFEKLNYNNGGEEEEAIENSIEEGGNFKKIINNSIVDSLIYMKGHHFRITSEPFITFFETLKENQDYFSSLEKYREFLENLLNSLLFETIIFDPSNKRQLEYKIKLDLLQRETFRQFKVYYNYGTCPEPQRHEESDLRKLNHLCKTFSKRPTIDFIQESKKYLSNSMLSNGILNSNKLIPIQYNTSEATETSESNPTVNQLLEGLNSCIPSTITLLEFSIKNSNNENPIFNNTVNGKLPFGISSIYDLIDKFSKSSIIYKRLPLSQRFLQFIQSDDQLSIKNEFYKQLIELEEQILELTQEQSEFEENPILNWVSGMSIELGDDNEEGGGTDIEYNECDQFNILPSQNYKLVEINNHLLSIIHKTFSSEELDYKLQELEFTIKNKKVLERELKLHNDKLINLIIEARDSSKPTLYFLGIQDNQVYTLEIAKKWEPIWKLLKNYPNGISLKQFIDQQTYIDKSEFLKTLTELNKYGVVGLFPKF